MEAIQRRFQAIVTDWRIWSLTILLIGWPVIGLLAEITFILESATPLIYIYQLLLHALIQDFPGFHLFWAGFALFCFSSATVLFSTIDWVRIRQTTSKESARESTTND